MIGFITGLATLMGAGAIIGDKLKGLNQTATDIYKKGTDIHIGANRSYVDMAQVARIEPLMLVDQSIVHIPEMNNISQASLSIFSGYFLQTVDIIGCQIDGISVGSVLNQLNPNRLPTFEAMCGRINHDVRMEDYRNALPMRKVRRIGGKQFSFENHSTAGMFEDESDLGVGDAGDSNVMSDKEYITNMRLMEQEARLERAQAERDSAINRKDSDSDRKNEAADRARQAKAAADEAVARHEHEDKKRKAEIEAELNERARFNGMTGKQVVDAQFGDLSAKDYEQLMKSRNAGTRQQIAELDLMEKQAAAALNRKKLLHSSYKEIQSELDAASKMPQEEYALYVARKAKLAGEAGTQEQRDSIEKFKKEFAAQAHTPEYKAELDKKEKQLQQFINYTTGATNALAVAEKHYAEAMNYRHTKTNVSTGDEVRSIHEAVNMSVGRVYKVNLKRNGHEATVPVTIRLIANILPSNELKELFTSKTAFDMDWRDRWHGWRAGRLSFWGDLILMNDLMDKRRKGVIRDQSDVMREINRRSSNNVNGSILSGKASAGNMSNIAIISQSTMEEVEFEMGGRMSNNKVRETVFNSTNLMLIFVVDPHAEMVKLYTRNIALPTTLSFKDLTAVSKKGGTDVTDIMKAYMVGQNPQF